MLSQLTGLQYNDRDVIESLIGQSFFADYGVITKINADKTVNVTHAVMMQLIDGTALPVTKTNNIEVIYPASASAGLAWPMTVGDGVLLIGLKNYVKSTANIQAPTAPPSEFPHYTQNTMKAIPLQSVSAPKFQIKITDTNDIEITSTTSGKYKIANSSKSLYTVLNSILTHITSLTTTNCVVGAPVVLSPATIANLNQDAIDLALLLKS